MDSLFFQSFVYLCAGVLAVPLAKRFGLGSVLGYLVAGVIIGPASGLVGAETQRLQEFAEFGVVMMLFLVGLELEPRQLWAMRSRLVGLGGLQFVATALAVAGLAFAVGTSPAAALAIGLMAAGSCTAIVLQTLSEKGLLESDGGKASFAVLLLQDIAVIPTLALLPLLAAPGAHPASGAASEHVGASLVQGLPGWAAGGVTLSAIALVVVGGHYLTRPLFRFIAAAQLREVFTATALLLVIGIALLMTLVGLSPALGAFLAGVVLADSEYRHELESDIEPFKGLLLGLFFITVGAGVDVSLLIQQAPLVVGLTALLILVKAAILYSIGGAVPPARRRSLAVRARAGAGERVRLRASRLLRAERHSPRLRRQASPARRGSVDAGDAAPLHPVRSRDRAARDQGAGARGRCDRCEGRRDRRRHRALRPDRQSHAALQRL